MDDFLDAPRSTYACGSVDDLTLHLGGLREQRVTPVRAEHISATFEFKSTAVFNVPETENDAADPQNLDPTLGGSPQAAPAATANGGAPPATQVIRAYDTLTNQPTDDPALQKLVAKHIITILGNADGSLWTVRSVSRNSSGWTFTYLCKSSTQVWMRQNSKNTAKLRVGESSGKDGQDPVNLARPAFDCRGSVTIAFSKNSRMITVKLAHTPLHKTVAELAELFKPPPPPPRAEVGRRKDGENNKRKSQAADGAVNGEEGGRKRKKKSTNPDDPAAEGDEDQTPKAKKPRTSKARKSVGADAQAQADSQGHALLNLSPSEAARRKDEATRKLRDAGIDPETLSTEQFDIFSNQSPELQTESLAMLVKYGAERLRIVHPNKDNASQPDGSASADGALPDGSTRKKKKSRKSGFNEDGTPKVKKTRGSCQACRAKKKKCSKAKPECSECVDAGIPCFYPPEQKRKPNGMKSAEGPEDEPREPASGPAPGSVSALVVEQADEAAAEEEVSDLGSPGFNSTHGPAPAAAPAAAPAPEMMAQPVHDSTTGSAVSHGVSHDLYQPAAAGLSCPQGVSQDTAGGTDYFQHQPTSSGMSYPHQSQQPPIVAYPEALSTAAQHVPQPVQAIPPQPTRPPSSHSGSRRTLPSGSGQTLTEYPASGDANHASHATASWQSTNATADATQPHARSPTVSQSAPSRQSRSRGPVAPSVYEAPQQEGVASATALSQAALQKSRSSPGRRRVSPFQTPARAAKARPRQGQRSRSRATASPFQQSSAQPAAVDASTMYNSSVATESNSLHSYDQYAHYNPVATQPDQSSSRVAYEPYSQQNASNGSSASYPSYDAYNSRSQAPSTSSLANPSTQSISSSYTKTTAPSSNSWSTSTTGQKNNPYSSKKAAGPSTSTYDVPASSAQQQPAKVQSFNVRPQPTLPQSSRSNTNTPTSYTQQPRQQQQHQSYSSYSSQNHNASSQQPQQQSQPQQDWYGFGSANNAASDYGSGSYSQHRSMDLANNSYSNLNEQEVLYEMFRSNPRH